MKKSIFFASLLASSVALAQTGRVGVNTATPVRTLDVEGDLRVKTVTDKSADAAYTNVLVQNPTTGLVDALPSNSTKFSDGSGNEPWQVVGSTSKATANTQSVYMNSQVGIGDFSTATFPASEKLRVDKGDIHFRGEASNFADLYSTYASDVPANTNGLVFQRSRGTLASPTAVQQNDVIGIINFYAHSGTGFTTNAQINTKVGSVPGSQSMNFMSPTTTNSDLGSISTNRYLTFNEDRSTTIGNLLNGSNMTNYPVVVVAKTDGTLGFAKRPSTFHDFKFKIPSHPGSGGAADFTNHSNTAFDSDNWFVVSKVSTNADASASQHSKMIVTYEYQGPAFADVSKLSVNVNPANYIGAPDVFVGNLTAVSNATGKTRVSVAYARVDTGALNWGAVFDANVVIIERP